MALEMHLSQAGHLAAHDFTCQRRGWLSGSFLGCKRPACSGSRQVGLCKRRCLTARRLLACVAAHALQTLIPGRAQTDPPCQACAVANQIGQFKEKIPPKEDNGGDSVQVCTILRLK